MGAAMAGTRLRPSRPAMSTMVHGGSIPTSYEALIFSYNTDDGGKYSDTKKVILIIHGALVIYKN